MQLELTAVDLREEIFANRRHEQHRCEHEDAGAAHHDCSVLHGPGEHRVIAGAERLEAAIEAGDDRLEPTHERRRTHRASRRDAPRLPSAACTRPSSARAFATGRYDADIAKITESASGRNSAAAGPDSAEDRQEHDADRQRGHERRHRDLIRTVDAQPAHIYTAAMPLRKINPAYIADHIRRVVKDGGSAPHAAELQWFFKEEVQSRGWYTAELRKVAVRFRRAIVREQGVEFLLRVADKLFAGEVLDEKNMAVFLLEKLVEDFGQAEFRLFESWLDRVSSWADHDALVHYLIAPMVAAEPSRADKVFRWARSKNRWRRRAACVALIRGARKKKFFPETVKLSGMLLCEKDDMVQKGLGWLLRETAKFDAKRTVPYLMKIRGKASRLVLRTACETLPAVERNRILARTKSSDTGRRGL